MSDAIWYYADSAGQQVGPMPVADLRAAFERGAVTMDTLAWRDGLAGWQPVRELAQELGIGVGSVAWAIADEPAAPAGPPPLATTGAADTNPYRAPESLSEEGFVGSTDVVYAGFWRRWAALFLDQIILGIPLSLVYFMIMMAFGLSGAITGGPEPQIGAILGMEFLFYLIWWGVGLFYFAGLESSEAQATFGKRALGIKVTDADGGRLSFKHAMGRWFAAALSYVSLYIGFIMAGFTQRKQALHDIVAGTLVVDKWAFTRFPERQERKRSGCVIVFMVMVLGSLVLIPILIAVAVSQYAEYARRAGQASYDPAPHGNTSWVTPASSLPKSP
jgi:uncharacterized RDD family membrane protein YckC